MSCLLHRAFIISALSLSPKVIAEPDELWPSEMTTIAMHLIRHAPDRGRTDITAPLVARMRTKDLDEQERFLKGEAHFLNFEPEPARDAYWEFRNRDDAMGRVANQRLMIIRVNAFGMFDQVLEEDIPAYRRRFGVSPEDRTGISYPIAQLARHYIQTGHAKRGLDLIVEEVAHHKAFDAPYAAYYLPLQFLEAAKDRDRGDEFLTLIRQTVDGLDQTIQARLRSGRAAGPSAPTLKGAMLGTLFADGFRSSAEWTALFMAQRAALQSALPADDSE